MKNAPPPVEVIYVRGGIASDLAEYVVDTDPGENEATRKEAMRKSKRRRDRERMARRHPPKIWKAP